MLCYAVVKLSLSH